ncbi:MAG: hypothetical protein U0800_00155 [Isosphaeraceae bacterium]
MVGSRGEPRSSKRVASALRAIEWDESTRDEPERWRAIRLESADDAVQPTLVVDRRELRRSIAIAPSFDPLAEVVAICQGTR